MLNPESASDPTTALVGALRDAVTTANGLLLLLRSRNVAPKAIAQLLPSLQDSFRGLPALFGDLRCSLEVSPQPSNSADRGLVLPESFVRLGPLLERQVEQFHGAIESGTRGSINARARLGLEQSAVSISHHLGALLALFELWSDTLRPFAVVDLVELLTLNRVGDQPPIPNRQVLPLSLVVESPQCVIHAPPRAILNWLALSAALLSTPRPDPRLGIRILCNSERASVRVESLSGETPHRLSLHLPATIPETEASLLDAIRRLRVFGARTDSGLAFEWSSSALVMEGGAN